MTQVPREVIWLVSVVMVEAAVIDWWKQKVPNWLTFHFLVGGLAFSAWLGGGAGLLLSFAGAVVGLALLLPLHAIGGMGAGDVKLMAGVGAWVGPWLTFHAFAAIAVVGGIIAVGMVVWTGEYIHFWVTCQTIIHEIITVRNPVKLSELAAARKSKSKVPPLPYGIAITVGTIGFFLWAGLMF